MIRKAGMIAHVTLIVALTMGAIGAVILWVLSVLSWPGSWVSSDPAWGVTIVHSPPGRDGWEAVRGDWPVVEQITLSAGNAVIIVSRITGSLFRPHRRSQVGFGPPKLTRMDQRVGITLWVVDVSLWLPAILLPIYPILVLSRRPLRRRRRRKRGLCVACGYNLKGLPEPRCPECGREFER